MAELQPVLTMLTGAGDVGVAVAFVLLGAGLLRVVLYAALVWWMARTTSRRSGKYPTFSQFVNALVALLTGGRGRRRRKPG